MVRLVVVFGCNIVDSVDCLRGKVPVGALVVDVDIGTGSVIPSPVKSSTNAFVVSEFT